MWGPCQKIRERVVKNIKIEEGNEGIGISGRKKETSASTSGGGTSGSTQGKSSTSLGSRRCLVIPQVWNNLKSRTVGVLLPTINNMADYSLPLTWGLVSNNQYSTTTDIVNKSDRLKTLSRPYSQLLPESFTPPKARPVCCTS